MAGLQRLQDAVNSVLMPVDARRDLPGMWTPTEAAADAPLASAAWRISTLVVRQLSAIAAVAVAAVVIGWPTAAVILALVVLAGGLDTAVNVHLLRRRDDIAQRPDQSAVLRLTTALAAGLAPVAVAAILWVSGPAELRIFCLAYLALSAVQAVPPVARLDRVELVRFAICLAAMPVLCLWDMVGPDGAVDARTVVQLVVALLMAGGLTAWVSQALAAVGRARVAVGEAEAARDEALEAAASRSAFIATLSHELRTPLNGILGMTQTLLDDDLSADQRARVQVLWDSGRTLTALLNDVLDLARMEAGKLEMAEGVESLADALGNTVSLYGPLAREKGTVLTLRSDPDLPEWLRIDGVRLRQCLANLVSNAVKFTDEGRVTVTARAYPVDGAPGMVEIEVVVADTGIGIAPEARARLFEPFAQGDPSIGRRFGGTGLGLDIARRIARMMQGDITCESAEGAGSTFTLTFRAPVATTPAEATAAARGAAGQGAVGPIRVLIVDDVETNRMVARLFLEPLGVSAVEMPDAERARDALREGGYEAALIDLRMPGVSGAALAAAVREGRAGEPDLPLIAISADPSLSPEDVADMGFDALVTKPLDQRGLQAAVWAALARRLAPFAERRRVPPRTPPSD